MEAPLAPVSARLPWVDAARGIALAAMVVYHFSWDLSNFGFIDVDVSRERGWVIFARLIAGSFLFLVGVSLVLAARRGFDKGRYLIRLAMIAAGAGAVTLITWLTIPEVFVFFGILHLIAVASVLALPFLRLPVLLTVMTAVGVFLVWWYVSDPIFDRPELLWVGLGTVPPQTNDYTPIFPWFGVVLAGMAVARLAIGESGGAIAGMLSRPAPRPLVFGGRHSLAIYLIHQPLLYGVSWLAAMMIPPNIETFRTEHLENCTVQCVAMNADQDFCERACACVGGKVEADGMWQDMARGRFSAEQNDRYRGFAEECIGEIGEVPGQ